MDNNIEFITSIKKEADFEELVRRFTQRLLNTSAFLVGGPYDGGRDLVWLENGKEVREAAQISTQEKNLEKKLEEDLVKVSKLVKTHAYPPVLTFFWSHPMSASKEDELKTNAKKTHRIQLEIYDAKKIGQKITNDYPELLGYLLETIHSYKPVQAPLVDIRERALYEYLALSKDTTDLRGVIVESQIVSHLYERSMYPQDLITYVENLGLTKGKAAIVIYSLKSKNRLIENSEGISLSIDETQRIKNIEAKDAQRKEEILSKIGKTISKYTSIDFSEEVLTLIKTAYAASVEIQISEINLEPPKVAMVRKAASEIAQLLQRKGTVQEDGAKAAAHELITIAGSNEYLSGYCSSRLCIGLLNQKSLLKYIEDREFFIYLDAPVLIRYIALLRFSKLPNLDNAFRTVSSMRDCFAGLKHRRIRATIEHFEESIRHLENAEKISRFASDSVIASLGDSKNVFFNLYLRVKKDKPKSYTFANFLEDLIGYESSGRGPIRFDELLSCAHDFLKLSALEIVNGSQFIPDYMLNEFFGASSHSGRRPKRRQTVINDVIAGCVLGDDHRHLDKNGVAQAPLLVTWDNSQYDMREVFRRKRYNSGDWLIYSPQRAIERLSMVALKIPSTTLKEGVLALIDEDFFRDSGASLVDTLALFLGEDVVETGAVVSLLTKLVRKLTYEHADTRTTELEGYNTLNEVLIYTQQQFSSDFSNVRKLFAEPKYEAQIFDLLRSASSVAFDENVKAAYLDKLRKLLLESEFSTS